MYNITGIYFTKKLSIRQSAIPLYYDFDNLLILNKRNLITTAYGNAIINLWSKKVVPKKVATKK